MKNTNPESESQAQVDTVGHFINGKIVYGSEDAQVVYNPADGSVLRVVTMGTDETVKMAF